MSGRLAALQRRAQDLRERTAAIHADGAWRRWAHLFVTTGAALVGYAWFVAPFLLTGILGIALPAHIAKAAAWSDWLWVGAGAAGFLLCAAAAGALARLRLPPVAGQELSRAQVPALFAEVDELCRFYGVAPVERVCLSEDFGVELLGRPRWGLPFAMRRTLRIGLPLLLTLSPVQCRVHLARRFGQVSLHHNRWSGWLGGLRHTWAQYCLAGPRVPAALITRSVFRLFSPAYLALSRSVARADELEADRYALDLLNHEDVVDALCAGVVAERFLQERFWPKLRALAARRGEMPHLPYDSMARVYRRGLSAQDARAWLQAAMHDSGSPLLPPLGERLHALGHDAPTVPRAAENNAATQLLGRQLAPLIQRFDHRWRKRFAAPTSGPGTRRLRPTG